MKGVTKGTEKQHRQKTENFGKKILSNVVDDSFEDASRLSYQIVAAAGEECRNEP